ncbi:MAG: CHASE domain-containing protein [Candidatus Omnitrophica bacterium]|nr:CHASE domain-containing protein [Candidatus Omnitrophota bacterium]
MSRSDSLVRKDVLFERRLNLRRAFSAAFFAFLVALAVTLFMWRYVQNNVEKEKRIKFEALTDGVTALIRDRLEVYIAALYGAQGLLAANQEVESVEWAAYFQNQNLKHRYPGMAAMRLIERVPAERKNEFIQSIKSDPSLLPKGYSDFKIHSLEEHAEYSMVKKEYFVVKYVQPYEGNEEMMGLDVSSEAVHLDALERARDTGDLVASGRIALRANGKEAVFLIALPIYRSGMPVSTVSERRAALFGFVDGVFRANDFFAGVFGKKSIYSHIEYRVFDGEIVKDDEAEDRLLYFSGSEKNLPPSFDQSRFRVSQVVHAAGRVWSLHFWPSPGFGGEPTALNLPQIVLIGGLSLSFLLWGILFSLSSSRLRAVELAEKITEELRASEEQNRSIIETATDAFISMNSKGVITRWNSQAETTFGWPRQEALGRMLAETIFPPEDREAYKEGLQRFLTTGEWSILDKRIEVTALHRDRHEFLVELVLWPVRANSSLSFNAFFHDITERKRAEEALKKANEELAANENRLVQTLSDLRKAHLDLQSTQVQLIQAEKFAIVAQLASGVAHEVKNPLAVLLQGTDYLEHHLDAHDRATTILLQDMTAAVERADSIIKGLLDFAAPTELTFVSEKLERMIEDALLLVRYHIEQNSIEVIKNFRKDLPAVRTDKNKITHVLINLFSNAIDAMPHGGKLTINAGVKKAPEFGPKIGRRREDAFKLGAEIAFIEIKDTGIGIPEEILPKVFDPFFTTKRGRGGTGLGLSVVRSIMELHSGTITLENVPGGGVQATLNFPIHELSPTRSGGKT